MATFSPPRHPSRHPVPLVLGILAGALLGFGLGAGSYLGLSALLEVRGGWIEELQGMTWNLVPLLTIVGGAVGAKVVGRRP